jgi:hypothetical protein
MSGCNNRALFHEALRAFGLKDVRDGMANADTATLFSEIPEVQIKEAVAFVAEHYEEYKLEVIEADFSQAKVGWVNLLEILVDLGFKQEGKDGRKVRRYFGNAVSRDDNGAREEPKKDQFCSFRKTNFLGRDPNPNAGFSDWQ